MKRKFIDYFKKYNINEDEEILEYGLLNIYIFIEKTIILFFISILLGILKEITLLLFFFSIIRSFAMGIHMSTSKNCTIASILIFVFFSFMIKINISLKIKIVIGILSILIIIARAPVTKRTINKKQYKLYSTIIGSLFFLIGLYINSAFFALLIESFLLLPYRKEEL